MDASVCELIKVDLTRLDDAELEAHAEVLRQAAIKAATARHVTHHLLETEWKKAWDVLQTRKQVTTAQVAPTDDQPLHGQRRL